MARLFIPNSNGNRTDSFHAVLILVLPWERLKSLKAGAIEVSLDLPQIKGALDGLGLDRVESEQLRKQLSGLAPEIQRLSGGRIIWIDDNIISFRLYYSIYKLTNLFFQRI